MTASAEELVAEMDNSGVDVSVALGYGWTDLEAARLSNDYLVASTTDHDGRIVPFCSVDPGWGDDALIEVERCLSHGARGIGELHDAGEVDLEQGLRPLCERILVVGQLQQTAIILDHRLRRRVHRSDHAHFRRGVWDFGRYGRGRHRASGW